MDSRGHWFIASTFDKPAAGARELKIVWIAGIPSRNIVKYNPVGDQYQSDPHLFVRYADRGEPYDRFRYGFIDGDRFVALSDKDQVFSISDLY
jgi:hypothetical protein